MTQIAVCIRPAFAPPHDMPWRLEATQKLLPASMCLLGYISVEISNQSMMDASAFHTFISDRNSKFMRAPAPSLSLEGTVCDQGNPTRIREEMA